MTIGIGVVGFGFMGRTHAASWLEAATLGVDCKLRAICTQSATETSSTAPAGNLAVGVDVELPAYVRTLGDFAELLADPSIDIVSICTPTDTHVELATAALRAGKHVLLEKPVALGMFEIAPLIEEAARAETLCMPAHCMRFWPGWPYAREIIQRERYGRVVDAEFKRCGQMPSWNREFYANPARSGGALFDLHVHDADFILWCFGDPVSVQCTGTRNHVHAQYTYPGFSVTAEGGWAEGADVAFEMKFRITLERAVLDFSYDRVPALVVETGGSTEPVDLPSVSAYTEQALHLARAVLEGRRDLRVTLGDAGSVTALLEREAALLEGP